MPTDNLRRGVRRCALLALTSLHLAILLLSFAETAPGQTAEPMPRLVTSISPHSAYPRAKRDPDAKGSENNPAIPISPSLAEATPIEREAFETANLVRVKNGLLPLEWDAQLCRLARAHSADMAKRVFFNHVTPEGLRLRDRARLAGVHFRVIAENIAYNQGYQSPGAFAVERWMISPGHRENILESMFQASAIGVFVTADGQVYITELFITR
jgi:uncharacterized protein YkwD